MNELLDYIISLTHLYGLVHKSKVVEIYNSQNEHQVTAEEIDDLLTGLPPELKKNYVLTHQGYFAHETIIYSDEFDMQLSERKGKPYYVPDKEELLRYREDTYFEMTPQYVALRKYLTTNLFAGNEDRADMVTDDIQGMCQFGFRVEHVFRALDDYDIVFDSERQANDILQLVMNLANNTRIWENNGHTPDEICEEHEQPYVRLHTKSTVKQDESKKDVLEITGSEKKIGRNDPCPCGSGKKFKKCCLGL